MGVVSGRTETPGFVEASVTHSILAPIPPSAGAPAALPTVAEIREALRPLLAEFLRLEQGGRHGSPDTLAGYLRSIAQYLDWCARRALHPLTATADDVRRFLADLADAGRTPGTVGSYLNGVRRFYAAVAWRGLGRGNPAAGVRAPADGSDPADRVTHLDSEELARLFGTVAGSLPADVRDRAILALLGLQGLRTVEVHRLDVAEVPAGAGPMRVLGKGAKRRIVHLRDDVALAVGAWIRTAERLGLSRPEAPGRSPVFVGIGNRGRGRRLSRRALREIVYGRLEAAGLRAKGSGRLGPHALRHTYATLAYANGADLAHVQAELGHRDPRTTARYRHVVERERNNPAARIPVRVDGGSNAA